MKSEEVNLGQQVMVLGTVQNKLGTPGAGERAQSVILRLGDGQALNTNCGNLRPVPGMQEAVVDASTLVQEKEELHAKELQALRIESEQQLQASESVIKERDEWREKATAAEDAARQVALQVTTLQEELKAAVAERDELHAKVAQLSATPPEQLEKPQAETPAADQSGCEAASKQGRQVT